MEGIKASLTKAGTDVGCKDRVRLCACVVVSILCMCAELNVSYMDDICINTEMCLCVRPYGQSTPDAEHWKGDTGGKRDLSTKNFATFSSAPVVSMNCRTASPSVAIALPHRLTCIFIAKRI